MRWKKPTPAETMLDGLGLFVDVLLYIPGLLFWPIGKLAQWLEERRGS